MIFINYTYFLVILEVLVHFYVVILPMAGDFSIFYMSKPWLVRVQIKVTTCSVLVVRYHLVFLKARAYILKSCI